MELFNKVKGETEKTLQELKKWTKDSGAELTTVFAKLKKTGKNTTDGIVHWMKEVKLIWSKETEEKVRTELDKAPDKKDIKFTHFRETVFHLIEEKKKELGVVEKEGRKLLEDIDKEGGKLTSALEAGTSALKGTLGIKDDKTDGAKNS